jgi:hypothetical protein
LITIDIDNVTKVVLQSERMGIDSLKDKEDTRRMKMFAIRKGNTITIAPLEDALVGLPSGWAIRFADKPQFLFHISRINLDGSRMTMDKAIENCARIARREGLDLRSNACTAQVFELPTVCDYCDSIQNMTFMENEK